MLGRPGVVLLFAFSVASLVGCQSKQSGASSASPSAPAASGKSGAAAEAGGPSLGGLAIGDPAPAITLELADGSKVDLAGEKGKFVLVYFYPQDDTTGCIIEAKGIRDAWDDFKKAGVEVFGVSMQGADSHKAFAEKYSLPYPLVVDESGKVADAFKVPHQGAHASRQSFLIGKDGKVVAVWPRVDPSANAELVLAAAK